MTVYETPGLHGLELWRGLAHEVPLYRLRDRSAEYHPGLVDFLLSLHQGTAASEDAQETESLKKAVAFRRVVFCGGGTLDPRLELALHAKVLPFAFEIADGGSFAARSGALRIFSAMGWERGVALDLGQMRLKALTACDQVSVARDLLQLPLGANAIDASLGRTRLRDLIQAGLCQIQERCGLTERWFDGLVLALPVALSREGVAEPATYPGLFGPVQPIFSGLFRCPWVVLNDAVLAGFGFPPTAGEKTLIVTLGFGVGGALWM